LEVFRFSPSDGCPATATLLDFNASLAIPKCVLRFEASRRQRPRRSNCRPPGRLNRPGWPHLLVMSMASALWRNRVTQWFSGEPLETPRTRCSLHQLPLMIGSSLGLRLNQETVHDFVSLFLPPCRADPVSHQVPRTKPTCFLDTLRPHRQQPFALVLYLHKHKSSHNLHVQYLAKSQSTPCCQSLITLLLLTKSYVAS
jgi:hypothetical protein